MSDRRLRPFFQPEGVAVVGASADHGKLGYRLVRNLFESGFKGHIHLVNPNGGSLDGLSIHRTVAGVPDPVDLAVILIAARHVPPALRQCGERGIRTAIIASAGFAESGEEGRTIENECSRIAVEFGMRVIGPNCIGTIDTHHPIDATFLNSGRVPRGATALVSHSGAICAGIINMSAELGLGWSRIVSLGNQMDVNETDILPALQDDPETRAVALYLEGVRAPSGFVEAARSLSESRPVVVLKVGRSKAGRGAVASHTGALAGEDAVYEAVFRKAGIQRVETMEDLLVAAKAFGPGTLPRGRTVAVLTNAGGPGVAAIDVLARRGLTMATLSAASIEALTELLPPAATVTNPVDMLASASIADYVGGLRILVDDPGVDSILVVMPPPPHYPAEEAVSAMEPILVEAPRAEAPKPVVFALVGGGGVGSAARLLDSLDVPNFRFPEQAAVALALLSERSEIERRFAEQPPRGEILNLVGAAENLPPQPGFIRPDFAVDLALACGIPATRSVFASDAESVGRLAETLGFPVALKVASRTVIHKQDAGGVRLGLESGGELADAMREMDGLLSEPDDGFLIQPMQPEGLDVVVGAIRDPQFGPVVMFGTGGREIEQERDVTFDLAPLTSGQIREMLARTRVGRKMLASGRQALYDVDAVLEAVRRTAALIDQLECVEEFEINPLRVFAPGRGAAAIDVRCRRS